MLRDAHMAQELTAALARDIVQKSREENRMLDPGDKEK
jgi:hypothetical protein